MNPAEKSSKILLRALKEDGIDELYCPPASSKAVAALALGGSSAGSPAKEALVALRAQALVCVRCHELASTRQNVVFGAGNAKAQLMFVGEAPGADEDEQGLPFVGRAGQLLTRIIESIQLTREQVFIANVLKCRPPKNRPPKPDEIQNCEGYLTAQIKIIAPKVICALGTFAAQTLLKTDTSISRLRGQFYDYHGAKLICTYHPAYLLRSPGEKRHVWEDMKKIKRELEAAQ